MSWPEYETFFGAAEGLSTLENRNDIQSEATRPTLNLDDDTRRDLREIFSVYFEDQYTRREISSLSFFDSTMSSSQSLIESLSLESIRRVALFMELSLRGISQVYFQNNPLSGLLILTGLFIQSPPVALHGILALVFGNFTAYVLKFDMGLARSGLFGYNAVLVGLAPATFSRSFALSLTLFSIHMACLSSILLVTLGKLLGPYNSPALTLPFNLVTMLFLLATVNMNHVAIGPVVTPSLANSNESPDDLNTAQVSIDVCLGTIRGIGLVFLADHLVTGVLVLIGIAVSSRIAAIAALGGSLLGAVIATATGVDPPIVAAGLYSYNASLTVTALVTFYTPSTTSALLAVLAGATTVIAQEALSTMLQPFGLPVMTLPFCIATLPFLFIQGTTPILAPMPLARLTVPEEHLYRARTLKEGFLLIKECIHQEEDEVDVYTRWKMQQRPSSFFGMLFRRQGQEGVYVEVNGDSWGEMPGGCSNDNSPRETRQRTDGPSRGMFDAIVKEDRANKLSNGSHSSPKGRLRLVSFQAALIESGLTDQFGIDLATFVFNLFDSYNCQSIDQQAFSTLCSVTRMIAPFRRKLFQFFTFIDIDQDGRIATDELLIDQTLHPTRQESTAFLTKAEIALLVRLAGCDKDCKDMDVMELINVLTELKTKMAVACCHCNTTDTTGSAV